MSAAREALIELARVLSSRDAALRRDEYGAWRIEGRQGWVYAVAAGFQIYCAPGSARAWTAAKTAMAFVKVTLDGDDEGLLFLDRLPTPKEAAILRAKLWIGKKRQISEEERARLGEMGRANGFVRRDGVEEGFRAQKTASSDLPSPTAPTAPETAE